MTVRNLAAMIVPVVIAALLGCGTDFCEKFCDDWDQTTAGQKACVTAMLEMRGYPVLDTPACIGVEQPEQCRNCREILGIEADDCRAIHETCIIGRGLSGRAAGSDR